MAFSLTSQSNKGIARINLVGDLDGSVAEQFRDAVAAAAAQMPRGMVLDMSALDYMSSAGLRVLVFARQKMGEVELYVVGANEGVVETIEMTGFHHSVIMLETYDAAEIEKSA
ncbi:MAG: STAS domain-containing protein [Chloroflexota bacterium]